MLDFLLLIRTLRKPALSDRGATVVATCHAFRTLEITVYMGGGVGGSG